MSKSSESMNWTNPAPIATTEARIAEKARVAEQPHAAEDDLWDDTTILAMYNASVRSHRTIPGRPKIKGESGSGGLSRKDQKKLMKQSKIQPDVERGPKLNTTSTLTGDCSGFDMSSLDTSSHAFVQDFLAQTNTSSDFRGGSEAEAEAEAEAFGGAESYAAAEVGDVLSWVPLQGGPYHNCYFTVQHHHHHYHGSIPMPNVESQPASTVTPTPEALQAWDELCAAKEQYDAALSRYESFISR